MLRSGDPALLHLDHPATTGGLLHGQIVFILLLFVALTGLTGLREGEGAADLKYFTLEFRINYIIWLDWTADWM